MRLMGKNIFFGLWLDCARSGAFHDCNKLHQVVRVLEGKAGATACQVAIPMFPASDLVGDIKYGRASARSLCSVVDEISL